MWKPSQPVTNTPAPTPEPARAMPVATVADASRARAVAATAEQAVIGKGLVIKGEISGSESLFVDGKVEGSINLPGNRVTVGAHGQVISSGSVCISAREIVVMGKIHGSVIASDRVDIRAEGALSGDVTAARISIEDGAFFKGGIDIRKADPAKPDTSDPAAVRILGE